jgi:hypothetical protein
MYHSILILKAITTHVSTELISTQGTFFEHPVITRSLIPVIIYVVSSTFGIITIDHFLILDLWSFLVYPAYFFPF